VPLPRILADFGAASYAVYLVHPVALSLGVHMLRAAAGLTPPLPIAVLMLAAAGIGAGILFHRLVEPTVTRLAEQGLAWMSGHHRKIGWRRI
jgi:peptidoglycan/LPS O-acetylase OafA/YrhL